MEKLVETVDPAILNDLESYVSHRTGVKRITNIRLTIATYHQLSENLRWLPDGKILSIESREVMGIHITFDAGSINQNAVVSESPFISIA